MAFKFFMRRSDKKEEKKPVVQAQQNEPIVKPPAQKAEASKNNQIYAFIDASNLFWGGKESIGFKIDYKKLLSYLKRQHHVTKAFYYGGLRIFDFEFSILDNKDLDLAKVETYLKEFEGKSEEKDKLAIQRSLNKINFYKLLETYGFVMKIKPAKVYYSEEDEEQTTPILKANCDVDMTFDIMRYMQQYSGIVAMTGDGDFAPVLSYLKSHDRTVTIISRWDRTASEIRKIAGDGFVDFEKLRSLIYLKQY
jgi:uncharacterized LabA/DUF88 family protein